MTNAGAGERSPTPALRMRRTSARRGSGRASDAEESIAWREHRANHCNAEQTKCGRDHTLSSVKYVFRHGVDLIAGEPQLALTERHATKIAESHVIGPDDHRVIRDRRDDTTNFEWYPAEATCIQSTSLGSEYQTATYIGHATQIGHRFRPVTTSSSAAQREQHHCCPDAQSYLCPRQAAPFVDVVVTGSFQFRRGCAPRFGTFGLVARSADPYASRPTTFVFPAVGMMFG